ncbi:hypothetical protein ACWD6I_19950, partial [Streptomyces sp. NPDC002454]
MTRLLSPILTGPPRTPASQHPSGPEPDWPGPRASGQFEVSTAPADGPVAAADDLVLVRETV